MNSVNKSKLTHNIGYLGEELVAQWLQQQGFQIFARRWRCLWGEIDLVGLLLPNTITKTLPKLVFVEVKTRRQGNWDAGGLLAITPAKQAKIRQSAAFLIAEYPDLSNYACQFDVALVHYLQANLNNTQNTPIDGSSLAIGKPISIQGYTLYIQDYIESAFD
ncbi:YraN family protein [Merismopedia glauca]|uniref:UPF0102 protein C7B64_02370 n=1 Tax=Merismopedia glauca CCAP 1448/3 TaxID=1296344 RepID=A0A2T1C9B1_9CYAN|nr:YraN family protein [Merismopedia glauca]PSB04824.1 YraN family protein [Merismopedia glauca CCAP 1448/3]